MKILLDTCTFLWLSLDDSELSENAKRLFTDPSNEVYFSAVSAWEICVKYSLGRLTLPKPPLELIPHWRETSGVLPLALEEHATLYETRLPKLHTDPFDRMLICQSIVHGLAILTPDADIAKYAVHTVW